MRIAQLGYGRWGRKLLRGFSEVERIEPVLVCDPDRDALREVVAGIDTHLEPGEAFCRPEVDAILVCSPPRYHFEQAREALQARKHVFVEKPLAMTRGDAAALVRLARSVERVLMVGHVVLFDDAVRWVKRYLDAGGLGTIVGAYFDRLNNGRVRRDVDALWNLAPHDIAMANFWFGDTPESVAASGASLLRPGVEGRALVNLQYPKGRFAQVHVSWLEPSITRRAVIVGSHRTLVYDATRVDGPVMIYERGLGATEDGDESSVRRWVEQVLSEGQPWRPEIQCREPLQLEAAHFRDCIERGEEPLADGVSGLAVVSALEAASRSRRSCYPVSVEVG